MSKKTALLLCLMLLFNTAAHAETRPAEEICFSNESLASSGGFFTESGSKAEKWTKQINKSIMSGFCSCVVYGDCIFTAADQKIYKIDRFTGETLKTAALYGSIGYTYYMAQADGMLFVQLKNGIIQAFSADTLKSLWISEPPVCGSVGQGLSPIVCDSGHIYACTVVTAKNYGTGSYYCLDTADEIPTNQFEVKKFTWQLMPFENDASASGFYGTGAAVCGSSIVFGSEGGIIYLADKKSGEIKDSFLTGKNTRSGMAASGSSVFFTTKSGDICSLDIENDRFCNFKSVNFCADSSCEPVVYKGRIYVGGTDGGYTKGVFCVFDADTLEELAHFGTDGNVQARPLVISSGGNVYAYFTCNNTPGRMMRLTDSGTDFVSEEFYTPDSEHGQYCMNRVNIDPDGVLYYQNDSGWLAALDADIAPMPETSTETVSETTTEAVSETAAARPHSSHSGGGGGTRTAEYINADLEIIGDTAHGTAPHEAFSVWLESSSFRLEKGSTAEDLVLKALQSGGFKYTILPNGYVSEVTAPDGTRLSEFTNGPNSGWMYKVNGVFVQTAMRGCTLNDGDTVVFLYSDDYTLTDSMYGGASNEPETETTTLAETTAAPQAESITESLPDIRFFDDVEENIWYFYPVECLHAAGIVNGRDGSSFCPADNVTRAEFMAMLYRAAGKSGYKCSFADVPADSWYYNAAAWAENSGIIYGRDKTHFAPEQPITRQEAIAVLYRLAGSKKAPDSSGFADESQIAAYALPAAAYFAENGIIKGFEGKFMPLRSITRAETAVMLFGFIENEIMK